MAKVGDVAYVSWVGGIILVSVSAVATNGNSVKLAPINKRDYVGSQFRNISTICWTWEAARAQLVMEHDKECESARHRLRISLKNLQDAMAMEDPDEACPLEPSRCAI